ncbi:MAG: ATP-dependent zinc protease family protein [Gammaproteobacteria bacterium]
MYINKKMLKHFATILLIVLWTFPVILSSKEPAKVIAGWVENVRIENQNYKVKAKLDTGAKTSSIHATNIESFKKNEEKWVRFTLSLADSKENRHKIDIEKPRSRKTSIKNHDGSPDKRYVVDLQICFNGRTFTTEFTLADRSEYIYDVLLGRQFLKNVTIIDPDETFLTLAECS